MRPRRKEYLSYLLRLWRVSAGGAPAWRGSLHRPGAAEAIAFADLDALVAFLRAEMEEGNGPLPLPQEPRGSALPGFPPSRE